MIPILFKRKPFHGLTAPPLTYLGTPYSYKHDNPEFVARVKQFRFEACTRAAGWLMNEFGWNIFSPITHSHPMHVICSNIRGDWEFWKKVDLEYLQLCSRIVVLTLPGWKESTGLTAELQFSEELGLETLFMQPHNDSYLLTLEPAKIEFTDFIPDIDA